MIILFGKPGAGKGTQANLLVQRENYIQIEVGELLRKEAKHNEDLATIVNAGKLIGGDILYPIIGKQLSHYGHQRIILDGFPRNQEQANWLKSQLDQDPPERIDLVILEISDGQVRERLAKRGRADDTDEAITMRLNIYRNDVSQAIELLGSSANVHYIDGMGSVEAVYQRILQAIKGTHEDSN